MKAAFISICISTSIYVLIASSMWGTPTWINLPFEFMRLMYIPSAIVAAFCGVISFYLLVSGKDKIFYGACLIFCILAIAYYSYRPEYFYMKGYYGDGKLLGEYQDSSDSLLIVLMTYYRLHPERFHSTGEEDFVSVDGFTDYVRSISPALTWSGLDPQRFQIHSDKIKTREDTILTPWGAPIRFLLNTNGDYYVKIPDGKAGIDEVNDPWRKHGSTCKAGCWYVC